MDFISFQTASAIGPSLKSSFVLLVTLDQGLLIPLYHSFGDREGVVQFEPPAHCYTAYIVDDDYAYKEGIQSTVNGLTKELVSIKELLLQMVLSQDPNDDHAPVQNLHINSGPVLQTDGPAPSMSVLKNLLCKALCYECASFNSSLS